jgi:penicillin-binding protein 1A
MKPDDMTSTSRTIDGWTPQLDANHPAGDAARSLCALDQHGRAKIGDALGSGTIADMAHRFLAYPARSGLPSMVLGTSDVRLIDMTRALPRSRTAG